MCKLNKLKSIVLLALMSLSAVKADPTKKQDFTHEFTAGLESFDYHYDETFKKHKKFMEFNGLTFGVNGSYQLTYKNSFFVRPEARWAYGNADYKSSQGSDRNKHHIPSLIFETRLLVGVPFNVSSQLTVFPHTGMGYRYKSDDMSDIKSKANIAGYKRVNKLWYVPLGMRFNHDFENSWFIQGLAEYDWMIQGRHLTYNKHFAPSPLVNKQKSGWGARGELLAGYHFYKASVAFGPYLNYWKIKKSSTERFTYYNDAGDDYPNTPGVEPANMTREMGIKLNFTF